MQNHVDTGAVSQQERRFSFQSQQPKRSDPNPPKKTGFGLFSKMREDDDERDQLKKLKAENKELRAQLRDLEIKSNKLGAENERYKSVMAGNRKINTQLNTDSYYASALERLAVGTADWTVTHFRGKSSRVYTIEAIEEIRSGLRKLTEANAHVPSTLHWVDVDLQRALTNSKFRIAFVLHVIGLHLHEKIFSAFSYEIEDFGLGYWLKRVADEVEKSGTLPRLHFLYLSLLTL